MKLVASIFFSIIPMSPLHILVIPIYGWHFFTEPSRACLIASASGHGQIVVRSKSGTILHGLSGIMEKGMETTIVYGGYVGIMEKKMETSIVSWVYIGIMEKT